MEKINKSVYRIFFIALGLSIGFPIGVLCVIFGAIKWIIPLFVTGIVLTVAGFYVMPIMWVQYGSKRQYRMLINMIENEYIYTVRDLSTQTGLTEKRVREMINKSIVCNYLSGYLYKDDMLVLNTNKKHSETNKYSNKCENCGGMMKFDGKIYICEYCGYTSVNNK